MIKKKTKSSTTAKKTTRKRSAPRSRKDRNPAAVHDDIARIVESGAKRITKAVLEQAMAGQLAPAKYLFEMAEIYPEGKDGSHATADEECLAATLLRRLDLPDNPVGRDEEDAPKSMASAEIPTAKPEAEKESGSEAENCEESKEEVLV